MVIGGLRDWWRLSVNSAVDRWSYSWSRRLGGFVKPMNQLASWLRRKSEKDEENDNFFWGPYMGNLENGWFLMEHPLTMDYLDWFGGIFILGNFQISCFGRLTRTHETWWYSATLRQDELAEWRLELSNHFVGDHHSQEKMHAHFWSFPKMTGIPEPPKSFRLSDLSEYLSPW